MSDSAKHRCVYIYTRARDTKEARAGTPYYVGKGTVERAYNWHEHPRPHSPSDPRHIHILAKDMSDEDACQAEMFLIHLYGRFGYRKGGILLNRKDGGDGPASKDRLCIERARRRVEEFWVENSEWELKYSEDGYWYADEYPRVRWRTSRFLSKDNHRVSPPEDESSLERQVRLMQYQLQAINRSITERVQTPVWPNDADRDALFRDYAGAEYDRIMALRRETQYTPNMQASSELQKAMMLLKSCHPNQECPVLWG